MHSARAIIAQVTFTLLLAKKVFFGTVYRKKSLLLIQTVQEKLSQY